MNKILDLNNSSNTEQIVDTLLELIKKKDNNILNGLSHFNESVILKSMHALKEFTSTDSNDPSFRDKKKQLEVYTQGISNFIEIFHLLDKRIDNEIQHNTALSKNDKDDLQHEFLFSIRQKNSDLLAIKKQCQTTLSLIEENLNDKNDVNKFSDKSSFSENIKNIKGNLIGNNSKSKIVLKN